MKNTIVSILLIILISCTKKPVMETALIPEPVSVINNAGFFKLKPSSTIKYSEDSLKAEAEYLALMLRPSTGYNLPVSEGRSGSVILKIDLSRKWEPEGYKLEVKPGKIIISSGTRTGIFRAVQSLRQLLPPEIEASKAVINFEWRVPCCVIDDYPRFPWRGMHLDVSRHFLNVDFVKEYIDLIALHRMNIFHFHLVDDQGWRIEIKKYPLLTSVGAWRVDREGLPWHKRPPQKEGEIPTYGGFYTRDQIKDIIDYAAERHITVIPEIEMPAHVSSALAAYPGLSCTGGPFTVPTGSIWPITDIYCAGKDQTFTFLEDVLSEVIELFPSPYIHIGGDEANKKEWKKCPLCQARIKAEGLNDESELQSYFIKRIEKFITSKGRKMIGWDEILEGGLAPGAAVMSWRGTEGGVKAAETGHFAVITPVSHTYFNLYQADPAKEPVAYRGVVPLKKVYDFDPVPEGLPAENEKYIIGSQGNLWSEFVSTPEQAEYQVLPRMSAMSEVVWSRKEARNYESFKSRLTNLEKRFEIMGLNFSRSYLEQDK